MSDTPSPPSPEGEPATPPALPAALLSGGRRAVYIALGLVFTGIGLLGAALPVLPTTPFLLLASFFFARSSPRLSAWLERSPLFGPFLQDWRKHHGVRLHVKVTAVTVVVVVIGLSIALGNLPTWLVVVLLVLGLIGITVILSLRTVRDGDRVEQSPTQE
jgi:hypothetical protein